MKNKQPQIFIQTIPDFCIFINGQLVCFTSSKCRNILAAIIGGHGISLSNREIIQKVWNKKPDKRLLRSYRVLILRLKKILEKLKIADIITTEKINRKIYQKANTNRYTCDFIEITKGNLEYISRYKGQYMESYQWNTSFKTILEYHIDQNEKLIKKYRS